jgi:hypothetical protein
MEERLQDDGHEACVSHVVEAAEPDGAAGDRCAIVGYEAGVFFGVVIIFAFLLGGSGCVSRMLVEWEG